MYCSLPPSLLPSVCILHVYILSLVSSAHVIPHRSDDVMPSLLATQQILLQVYCTFCALCVEFAVPQTRHQAVCFAIMNCHLLFLTASAADIPIHAGLDFSMCIQTSTFLPPSLIPPSSLRLRTRTGSYAEDRCAL